MQKPSKVESFVFSIEWDFWFIKMFWENSFTSWTTQKFISNFLGRLVRVATNFFLVSFFMILEKNVKKKISWRLFHKVGSYLDVSMGKLLPPRCWAESNSLDWNRVNIFENLGVTTVVPVVPIFTSLGLIQNIKMNWAMNWFVGALTVKLWKVDHAKYYHNKQL